MIDSEIPHTPQTLPVHPSPVRKHAEWVPHLALVITTAGWGLSFSLMRSWQTATAPEVPFPGLMSGLVLIFIRMILALGLFLLLQPRIVFRMKPRDWAAGLGVGFPLWTGFTLQLWGLEFTTPAKSAFFTSICSLWVPVIFWLFGKTIAARVWLGFAIAAFGLVILVEGGLSWGYGEGLTMAGSFAFALQILALDRFGKGADGNKITPGLFLTNFLFSGFMILGLCAISQTGGPLFAWSVERLCDMPTLINLGLMVLIPTLMSYSLMNAFQPLVSAEKAAMIYLLEPIFSYGFSLLFGLDQLQASMIAGGIFVICGVIVVETQNSSVEPAPVGGEKGSTAEDPARKSIA